MWCLKRTEVIVEAAESEANENDLGIHRIFYVHIIRFIIFVFNVPVTNMIS